MWEFFDHGADIGVRGVGATKAAAFEQAALALPDRELACAPIASPLGRAYLGAMRAAINCAFANRQILTQVTRDAFAAVAPAADLPLLYDVSHNTCKVESHVIDGRMCPTCSSPSGSRS